MRREKKHRNNFEPSAIQAIFCNDALGAIPSTVSSAAQLIRPQSAANADATDCQSWKCNTADATSTLF